MNSGYIMVDFSGMDFAIETAQTVSGVFVRLTEAFKSGKTVIGFGAKDSAKNSSPFALYVVSTSATKYTCYTGTYQLEVTNTDGITVTQTGGSSPTPSEPFATLDLEGLDLEDDTRVTLSGVYAAVTACYESDKPVLVTNCAKNGRTLTPFIISLDYVSLSGVYGGFWGDYELSFQPTNVITVSKHEAFSPTVITLNGLFLDLGSTGMEYSNIWGTITGFLGTPTNDEHGEVFPTPEGIYILRGLHDEYDFPMGDVVISAMRSMPPDITDDYAHWCLYFARFMLDIQNDNTYSVYYAT